MDRAREPRRERELTGRGHPYTRTINPRSDGGYYVSKAFNTTGAKTVTLNVHWEG